MAVFLQFPSPPNISLLCKIVALGEGGLKRDWAPTKDAFRQFLLWLDEGAESNGEKYLEIRRRLVLYFDRKNCLTPDELADETLSRVAGKLQEQGKITDLSPAHYCYVTARFVYLEHLRRPEHKQRSLEQLADSSDAQFERSASGGAFVLQGKEDKKEERLDSLERCLNSLAPADRDLILEYYRGEGATKIESRRRLAERLGLSMNALSIRACRIRTKLEECVRASSPEA
jgi:DNA-directed RNA polymerase specialized sigma24 family protein